MQINKLAALTLAALSMLAGANSANAAFANVVSIVDESGSMSGEHTWLGGMMTSLDSGLIAAGLTSNNYGLVGYGNGISTTANAGRQINVGGAQFGTAAQFSTAAGSLVISGSQEDGYAGINFANSYNYALGGVRNYILVTDEDRDNTNAALTYNSILNSMTSTKTLLNAVVNATFGCSNAAGATIRTGVLGVNAAGTGYIADGAGGYTTCSNSFLISDSGTTFEDYVDLAWDTGGAAWDLNILRSGGLLATSFTKAFIDIKVQEITEQTGVPEPASLALLGLGLAGLGFSRRRKQA